MSRKGKRSSEITTAYFGNLQVLKAREVLFRD